MLIAAVFAWAAFAGALLTDAFDTISFVTAPAGGTATGSSSASSTEPVTQPEAASMATTTPQRLGPIVSTAQLGGIVVKRVGSDLTTRTAPAGNMAVGGGYEATGIPFASHRGIVPGEYTVEASADEDYLLYYGTCQYEIGRPACTIIGSARYTLVATTTLPRNGYISIPVTVSTSTVTKIVFKYLKPQKLLSRAAVKVEFIASGLASSTLLEGDAQVSTMPNMRPLKPAPKGNLGRALAFDLPTGILGYVVSNTPVSGYNISAGICQYSSTGGNCAPPSFSPASCVTGVCSIYLPYVAGLNQKIVYKYEMQGFYRIIPAEDATMVGLAASTTIPLTLTKIGQWNEPVSLSVSGLAAGMEAAFSDTTCTPVCTTGLNITTSSSTPLGIYPITITGRPFERQTKINMVVTANLE